MFRSLEKQENMKKIAMYVTLLNTNLKVKKKFGNFFLHLYCLKANKKPIWADKSFYRKKWFFGDILVGIYSSIESKKHKGILLTHNKNTANKVTKDRGQRTVLLSICIDIYSIWSFICSGHI